LNLISAKADEISHLIIGFLAPKPANAGTGQNLSLTEAVHMIPAESDPFSPIHLE
jgi:hypothetical protein